MISLIRYEEFGPGLGYKSMKEDFSPTPYEGQDEMVSYLEKGEVTYVKLSCGKDVFTGHIINDKYTGMTDGEYSWNSVLPYYVKTYNLRLPKSFENKVLKR